MSEAAAGRGPAAGGAAGNASSGQRTLQYTTFYLDKLFFGVETVKVQEVLKCQPTTPVALAPAVVSGLINLRGQIVTSIDLRRRLGLAERPPGQLPLNVVVRGEDGAVSLLVDEIGDVIDVNPELHEPPPENTPEIVRATLHGVYQLPDRLLLALATERLLQFDSAL
ncbi:MAG: chemotaxis protein CheW [Gemmatimonadales bacterium]